MWSSAITKFTIYHEVRIITELYHRILIPCLAGILINDGFCGGHFVEHNYIYDCVKETKDHGPFNSWGRERFWSELFNHPEYVPNGGIPTKSPAGPITHDVIHTITVRNNLFVYSSYEEEGTASDAIDMVK